VGSASLAAAPFAATTNITEKDEAIFKSVNRQRCLLGLLKKPPFCARFREGQAAIAVNQKNIARGGVCADPPPLRSALPNTNRVRRAAASRLRLIAAAVSSA
jgi:hypothetical protein